MKKNINAKIVLVPKLFIFFFLSAMLFTVLVSSTTYMSTGAVILSTPMLEFQAYDTGVLINITMNSSGLTAAAYNLTFYNTSTTARVSQIQELNITGANWITFNRTNKILNAASQKYRVNVSMAGFSQERITLKWNIRSALDRTSFDANYSISPYISTFMVNVTPLTVDRTPEVNTTIYSANGTTMACVLVNSSNQMQNLSAQFNALNATVVKANFSTVLQNGTHNFQVRCINTYGDILYSIVKSVYINSSLKPKVTFVNPATGVNLSSGTQAFNITVINDSVIDTVRFMVSNGTNPFNETVTNSVNGNWNKNLDLSKIGEGVHTVTAFVNDTAKMVNHTVSITIKVDRTAPTVNLHNASINTTGTTPLVRFNYSDAVSKMANCTVYMNGVNMGSNASTRNNTNVFIRQGTALSAGRYVTTVNCTDYSGNTGNSSAIIIIVDTVPPRLTITNPVSGVNLSTGMQAFNVTVADSLTAVDKVFFQFSNGTKPFNVSTTNMSGNWNNNVLMTRVIEGVHTVTVFANDSLNNMNKTGTISIRVDRTAPTVNLYNSSFNTTTAQPTVYFNFTDGVSLTANCTMYMNGTHVASTKAVANATLTALTAGTGFSDRNYTVTINCTDASGNKGNSSAITIYLNDDGVPAVTINTPSSQWYRADFVVNVTVTDSSTLRNITYRYENSAANSSWLQLTSTGNNFYSAAHSITLASDGNYTFRINATDMQGNSNTSIIVSNIGIDDTDPSVSLSCTPTSVNTYGLITCSCTTSDVTSGVASDAYTAYPDTTYIGSYTEVCSATDRAGNSGSSSVAITVTRAGTSGGGGGGGSSSSSTATKTSHTVAMASVSAGATGSVSISKTNMPVTKISFTVKQAVGSPSVTVSALSSKPVSVSVPAGKTIRYLEVSVKNLDNSNVESSTMQFKVKKSELTDMGISESDIVLSRYTDGKWTVLPTTKVTSDANEVTYEATSPGFSYFAITSKSSSAFAIIDTINSFYSGTSDQTAFNIIDQINSFYGQ
ncbi:MAG: PGF-pre-PGF domain-containing protein [Nanoarchaeota archaeon]